MKITKIGHSCITVEIKNTKILIDPGQYSSGQEDIVNIRGILITHEHSDHLDMDSVKKILQKNSGARIYCNGDVGKNFMKEGIDFKKIEDQMSVMIDDVTIEAFGREHALIHNAVPCVHNTGFLIGGVLYHPGDAFFVPPKPVEILALPVLAPWCKMSEVLDFARKVKPRQCFPIHDAFLKFGGPFYSHPLQYLALGGIAFRVVGEREPIEI